MKNQNSWREKKIVSTMRKDVDDEWRASVDRDDRVTQKSAQKTKPSHSQLWNGISYQFSKVFHFFFISNDVSKPKDDEKNIQTSLTSVQSQTVSRKKHNSNLYSSNGEKKNYTKMKFPNVEYWNSNETHCRENQRIAKKTSIWIRTYFVPVLKGKWDCHVVGLYFEKECRE